MKRLFLILIVCSLASACTTNSVQIRISDKYYTEQILGTSDYYKEGEFQQRTKRRYYHVRYLIKAKDKSAEAEIINKSVEHAKNGNYREALILLEQVSKPFKGIVDNNKGVLYEISGDTRRAQDAYLRACRHDSHNRFFIENFNSL